jgi:hypothetical protein
MAVRCLIELGDPVSAEPLLSNAIAATHPSTPGRSPCTWLAESYARAGMLDAAHSTIDQLGRHPTM